MEICPAPKTESETTFDGATVCDGLSVLHDGRTVTKNDFEATPSFAVWSQSYDTGTTSWTLRIDRQLGIIFVGCLSEPYTPAHGFARNLGTSAWMLGSYGYVCRTGPNGQKPLTREIKEQIGDNSDGILSFSSGSILRITLDRDAHTLKFHVNDLPAFTLHGVGPRSRPFVNIGREGDSVSLIPEAGDRLRYEVRKSGVVGETVREEEGVKEIIVNDLQKIREEADNFWV